MMLYKLTNEHGKTQNDTQWGPGITHTGTGEGGLCGPGFIHAYEHQLVAVLMNPIHANFKNPRLWEAKGEVALRNGLLKCGCVTLTTIREITLPKITTEMWVRFGILCAREASTLVGAAKVCKTWNVWADKWLSGKDRSAVAAAKAAKAAAAVAAAETHAVGTAQAAYNAAAAAAEVAEVAETAEVALPVQWAASAAYQASRATYCGIDLAAIAEKACGMSRE